MTTIAAPNSLLDIDLAKLTAQGLNASLPQIKSVANSKLAAYVSATKSALEGHEDFLLFCNVGFWWQKLCEKHGDDLAVEVSKGPSSTTTGNLVSLKTSYKTLLLAFSLAVQAGSAC